MALPSEAPFEAPKLDPGVSASINDMRLAAAARDPAFEFFDLADECPPTHVGRTAPVRVHAV